MGRDAGARAAQAKQVRKDRQQAKVVLKQFREHYDKLDQDKEEVLDCRSEVLSKHFVQAADNLAKARTVDQAYVDAQIFHRLGDYSRRQAAQLQTGLKSYDVKSFVDSLVCVMEKNYSALQGQLSAGAGAGSGGDGEDGDAPEPMKLSLREIGTSVKQLFKTVPAIDFMYGNAPDGLDRPATQRRKVVRAKKGDRATKPAELVRGEIEQTETDKQVARMKRELKKVGSINFWQFVVDPDSAVGYTRTVENIFHSSFLIKDMYASLNIRSDPPLFEYCDPHARPNGASAAASAPPDPQQNSQIILGFDTKAWRKVMEQYDIDEPFLPPMQRTPSRAQARDANLERLQQLEAMGDDSDE